MPPWCRWCTGPTSAGSARTSKDSVRPRGIRKPGTSPSGIENHDDLAAVLSLLVDDSATKTTNLPAAPSRETVPSLLRWAAAVSEATLLKRLNIGGKLTLGFGILVALTLLVVGLNYLGSFKAVTNIKRTGELSAPSAVASAQAQANLLRMLSEVRGYLALGDEAYREGYRKARSAFDSDLQLLEQLLHKDEAARAVAVSSGVDSKLVALKFALERWAELPERLFELHNDQLRREPALKILVTDANLLIASIAVGSK